MNYYLKQNHWESLFFGRDIADVQFTEPSYMEIPIAEPVLSQAKVLSSDFEQLALLQRQGFQLVETELRFQLPLYPQYIVLDNLDLQRRHTVITQADTTDLATLQAKFGSAFTHSRFRPPYFSIAENQRFYQTWIENAVKGEFDDSCWLAKTPNGQLQGMISLRFEENNAYIGLLAVTAAFQRQGVAKRLIQHAKQQAKAQGAEQLFIRTQLSNSAAIAFYQSIGAELIDSYYWLYR